MPAQLLIYKLLLIQVNWKKLITFLRGGIKLHSDMQGKFSRLFWIASLKWRWRRMLNPWEYVFLPKPVLRSVSVSWYLFSSYCIFHKSHTDHKGNNKHFCISLPDMLWNHYYKLIKCITPLFLLMKSMQVYLPYFSLARYFLAGFCTVFPTPKNKCQRRSMSYSWPVKRYHYPENRKYIF